MLLEINFTLVIFAISFLIFIYLLNLTLYKPAGKIIEARKNQVEEDYLRVRELTDEANKILESYKSKINLARQDAHTTIQNTIDNAIKTKEGKILKLVSDLNKEKEIALKQLLAEKEKAIVELQEKLELLTGLIISKILDIKEKTLVTT